MWLFLWINHKYQYFGVCMFWKVRLFIWINWCWTFLISVWFICKEGNNLTCLLHNTLVVQWSSIIYTWWWRWNIVWAAPVFGSSCLWPAARITGRKLRAESVPEAVCVCFVAKGVLWRQQVGLWIPSPAWRHEAHAQEASPAKYRWPPHTHTHTPLFSSLPPPLHLTGLLTDSRATSFWSTLIMGSSSMSSQLQVLVSFDQTVFFCKCPGSDPTHKSTDDAPPLRRGRSVETETTFLTTRSSFNVLV